MEGSIAESKKVTIVGVPLSTFTRTICMALHAKGVAYNLFFAPPHSPFANEHHPMGLIPSLCKPGGSSQDWIFESIAIASYIDTEFTQPPTLQGARDRAVQILQWVSFISDSTFRILEHGLIKPRLAFEEAQEETEKQTLQKTIDVGLHRTKEVLVVFDNLSKNSNGPFLLGAEMSWADLYLAPIMADLEAIPEGYQLLNGAPHVKRWLDRFKATDVFQRTFDGTLAHLRGTRL
jgi:glutathione S-transferase